MYSICRTKILYSHPHHKKRNKIRGGEICSNSFAISGFLTRTAFLGIIYFFYKHAWLILGLASISYIFFAEQFLDNENEVKDERQIL